MEDMVNHSIENMYEVFGATVADDLEFIEVEAFSELDSMSGRSVLLVGGAGFLGYYFTLAIAYWNLKHEQKIQLTLADNFGRGVPSWIEDISRITDIKILEFDITSSSLDELIFHDYVIHAASIASPIFYRQFPIQTMDANVNGFRRLLDWSLRNREEGNALRGFLYFSTSEIYGDPDPNCIPTDESYRGFVSCTGPRACYDESKRYGETLAVNFAKEFDLPIKIARPFNNYGPGLKISDGRVIPDFARNILANLDIELLSDGTPTRTFCYVADAVVGYFKVLVNGGRGEPYNIGIETPEISIRDLASLMQEVAGVQLGYDGTLKFANSDDEFYLTDNPNRRCPSIKKAREEIDFSPKISLRNGIGKSLSWYVDQSKRPE